MEKYIFTAVDEGTVVLPAKEKSKVTISVKNQDKVVVKASDGASVPGYAGEYEITPTMSEQVFQTRSRKMSGDLTVHAIPYTKTTNPAGGYTAIIGG